MVSNLALTKPDIHLASLKVTMSPKSSLPQDAKSVTLVLTPNKTGADRPTRPDFIEC